MNTRILMLSLMLVTLTGCIRHMSITDPETNKSYSYTNIGFDTSIGSLKITTPSGVTFEMEQANSEAVVAREVVRAAVSAAMAASPIPVVTVPVETPAKKKP